jgi:hypothetical protein
MARIQDGEHRHHLLAQGSQGLPNKDALPRHRYTLPVGFDQRFTGQLATHHEAGVGKLGRRVAGLNHRAKAARGAGFEPAQTAHLCVTEQVATGRGQVIAHGARARNGWSPGRVRRWRQ